MDQETYQERSERYIKEADRIDELKKQHAVAGHASTTFVKNGRIYLLISQTYGIGIDDYETRRGYALVDIELTQPEQDTLVVTYKRNGASICLVGKSELLSDLRNQIQANIAIPKQYGHFLPDLSG